jgi:hypothetical protein
VLEVAPHQVGSLVRHALALDGATSRSMPT